jgi:Short C-terminal domain
LVKLLKNKLKMKTLTAEGQQKIHEIAVRYRLSDQAVTNMLYAVSNGGGAMAQFNIPELGGNGQWMKGGMTMVGDMFNYGLQGTVSNLCNELSQLLNIQNIFEKPAENQGFGSQNFVSWWPTEFGSPSSSGGQNNMRYAYFPFPVNRLAVELNGKITVYDTLNYQILGVSQQQSGSGYTLLFSSQFGNVDIHQLPVISPDKTPPVAEKELEKVAEKRQEAEIKPVEPVAKPEPAQKMSEPPLSEATSSANEDDIIHKIERLAGLLQKGILTEEEFAAKKKELLSRL